MFFWIPDTLQLLISFLLRMQSLALRRWKCFRILYIIVLCSTLQFTEYVHTDLLACTCLQSSEVGGKILTPHNSYEKKPRELKRLLFSDNVTKPEKESRSRDPTSQIIAPLWKEPLTSLQINLKSQTPAECELYQSWAHQRSLLPILQAFSSFTSASKFSSSNSLPSPLLWINPLTGMKANAMIVTTGRFWLQIGSHRPFPKNNASFF